MSETRYPSEPFPEEEPASSAVTPAAISSGGDALEPPVPFSASGPGPAGQAAPAPDFSAAPEPPARPGPPVPPVPPAPAGMPPLAIPLLPPPMPAVGYAGFWVRFVAWILDAFILYILGMGTNAMLRLTAGVPLTPLWAASRGATFASGCAESLIGIVVWWIYHATLESSPSEATPGKRALRLRVTDLQGRRITFGRATGRTFGKVLSYATLLVGFFMAGFTARRQALHDLIAETVVLRDLR